MEVEVAAAKVSKWATSESGDTLEMIERPRGGLSFVLVDGQRSGSSAKAVSNLVARKAITELAEGVRDGAAARAAHDYLYAFRRGKVSATLNIVSVDLETSTLVLSRNNPSPTIMIKADGQVELLDEPSRAVGFHSRTKPVISEFPLQAGQLVVVYTDGLAHAGVNRGGPLDLSTQVSEMFVAGYGAQQMADELLERALELEDGRPRDDISILVLKVLPEEGGQVRRMMVHMPIA
jgi:serine phosphatase RsbU (regulator of sigma subunit)